MAQPIVRRKLSPQEEQLAQLIRDYRKDPVRFVREQFRAEPDDWQKEYLESFRDNDRTCAKACKGPGKSCAMSWAGWWFLLCFPHAKGLATSITGDNLRDNLWAEMALWQKKSKLLSAMFEWNVERIAAREHPETWFLSARTWSKQADKSQQANTLAGHHGEYTFILIDEAGDIPGGVTAAADASLSTGKVNRILMAGNPTRCDGPLFEACTKQRHLWHVIEITGDPDDPKRAKRISEKWAREQIEFWGKDNPWVLVNVFGRFPPVAADKLLGPEEVESAMRRTLLDAYYVYEPRIMSVDVARFGDDRSVLSRRQGRVIFPQRVYRNLDLMALSNQIQVEYESFRPHIIFIDETGLGAGVVDRCRQLGLPVIGVNFGAKAQDPHFHDKRSEMWWRMATWVKGHNGEATAGCLPRDPEIVAELTGPVFEFTPNGKLKLESKDDMKKRGLQSPDKGDSIAMLFAEKVTAPPFTGVEIGPDGGLRPKTSGPKCVTEYDESSI